jgi:hypothetical protein
MKDLTYVDVVTFGIAIVGAFLGIINTCSLISRNRLRIRVTPTFQHEIEPGMIAGDDRITTGMTRRIASGAPGRWTIEVVNLSIFPVTIVEVGFGRVKRGFVRDFLSNPTISDGRKFPIRLEPREAVRFSTEFGAPFPLAAVRYPFAYAWTACGNKIYGTSPILKDEASRMRAHIASTK